MNLKASSSATTAKMNGGFDANALERGYAFLDECPERFLHTAITSPIGELSERVIGIRAWRNALLAGRLPAVDAWPQAEIAAPVLRALDTMGLVRFCKGQEDLVDDLLENILAAFSRQDELLRAEIVRRLRELEELERARLLREQELALKVTLLEEKWGAHSNRPKQRSSSIKLDDETLRRLALEAEREVKGRVSEADAQLIRTWGEHARAWAEIADIFGDLGQMLGRGWDLSLSVLHHTGWRDLLSLKRLVARLPELREIVRTLGRLHASETAQTVAERVFVPMRRLEEERLDVKTPLVPEETRGVERSGEISRMLPVEAAKLGHPKLRLLWHAHRAERALLTYRIEGIETERTLVETQTAEMAEVPRSKQERGPILAIVDTSGSMHGLPEKVAKAIALEALRTAHAEKRRCRLYAFGGPGQTIEHNLDLSAGGIGKLLDFLGFSFGVGTDPTMAVDRVLRQLQENKWTKSDVLLVSDGEWHISPESIVAVQQVREAGTRFHGVQVGNRGSTGLHEICQPVHVFTDWLDLVSGK